MTSSISTYHYAVAETAAGLLLVAVGETGIAAAVLGNECGRMVRDAQRSLPAGARLVASDAAQGAADAVAAMLAPPGRRPDIALELRGTPIELAVWQALRALPRGTTIGYGALAKTLPVAATAQEVGAACAANRIAIAIPCHRVVKADGSISGYRWGVERKRRLIELETAA